MGIGIIREGLPMSREPALLTSAGRMPERSQHRVSEGRMPKANVRRRGMGSPEPSPQPANHCVQNGTCFFYCSTGTGAGRGDSAGRFVRASPAAPPASELR